MACHSDAFSGRSYGAVGPLDPGPESRLTFTTANQYGDTFKAYSPSWSESGDGIVYSFAPRPSQPGESLGLRCSPTGGICVPVSRDSLDTCIALLPATGGSARWLLCEIGKGHTDSTDILAASAVNAAGDLLYEELTGPTDYPVPIGHHAELWLASSFEPLVRRQLLTLYHDRLGVDQTAPGAVNWLSETVWADPTTFYSIGQHLHPDSSIDALGIVRGAIGGNGATLSRIAGTTGATRFAVVDGGNSVIWIDGSLSVNETGTGDGTQRVIATIPPGSNGRLLDIGCRSMVCVLLTSERASDDASEWSLWRLELATGQLQKVRSYSHSLRLAQVSPVSGAVVALEGPNLFLLDSVAP